MALRMIGAGLPRTGTASLRSGLEQLLGGTCLHMRVIEGHPFDLGPGWDRALDGAQVDWRRTLQDFVAAVDWPAAAFWREIAAAHPGVIVVLSRRDSPRAWWESMEATVLPVARLAMAPDWQQGRDLVRLLERLTGTVDWDDAGTLMRGYQRQLDTAREHVPADRLVEWRAEDGWQPLCAALGIPEPGEPFPWLNRRADWG